MELASSTEVSLQWSGVSESQVKVAKKTLKVTVGNAGLTEAKKKCKLLKEVEALINLIPLTYDEAAPRD